MIQQGNGILIETDGRRFRLDPRRVLPDEVSMISHAHSDHLPTSFKSQSVICSEITKDFVDARCKKHVAVCAHEDVRSYEAGHIAGSSMFLVRGDADVLYTGDFCTRQKRHMRPARPRKCDILITEATYGRPQYVFPDHDEIIAVARDWLSDIVRRDGSAVLFAYPLGKSQELASALSDLPVVLHQTIAKNNRILARHGFELPCDEYAADRTKPPFIYITSGYGKDSSRVESMRKRGAKTAAFSGWALEKRFPYKSRLDEAFPLSDHCGYDELLEFVRKCEPRTVLTTHGFAKEFASSVRRTLGIDAQPMIARQRTLDHFC